MADDKLKNLKDMLDNLINGKPEQAQVVFHDYLKTRLNGVLAKPVEPTQTTDNE